VGACGLNERSVCYKPVRFLNVTGSTLRRIMSKKNLYIFKVFILLNEIYSGLWVGEIGRYKTRKCTWNCYTVYALQEEKRKKKTRQSNPGDISTEIIFRQSVNHGQKTASVFAVEPNPMPMSFSKSGVGQ